MRKIIFALALGIILSASAMGLAQASTLTFDDPSTLGVTLGGSMYWKGTGGGHLYMEQYYDDDHISFSIPTHVNSFQMNAMPWENYGDGNVGYVDIAAFDSSNAQVWSSTVDLRPYLAWDQWLTVSVEKDNVSSMTFYSPYNTHGNGFWPSIDNMVVNQAPVPAPAVALLFGSGLVGLAGFKKRSRRK